MSFVSPYKDNLLKKIYDTNYKKSNPKGLLPQLKTMARPSIRKPSPAIDLKASKSPIKQCKCEIFQEKIWILQKEKNCMKEIQKKNIQVQKEKDMKIRELEKEVKYLKREKHRAIKIIEYLKQKLSEKMFHEQSMSRSSIYIETQFVEDPFDNLSYEQLLELGEKIGNVNRGFTKEEIKKIPKKVFNKAEEPNIDKCAVCYNEFEDGEKIRRLPPCSHCYHSKCIRDWLLIERKCPMCQTEVGLA